MKLSINNKILFIIIIFSPVGVLAEAAAQTSERAVLGINIASGRQVSGPVEGVAIVGVTPDAAADAAGLRADDVLIAIDDVSLTAESMRAANARLLTFMADVTPGQELRLAYLRGGRVLETRLVADAYEPGMLPPAFPFRDDLEKLGRRLEDEFIEPLQSRWRHYGAYAGMELVALTPELGRYFGTDEGLLVVRAPESDALGFQDGDVIRSIGSRTPSDPSHAMRILRSYEPGEELVIHIYRDGRERELHLTLPEPEETTGWNLDALHDLAGRLSASAHRVRISSGESVPAL